MAYFDELPELPPDMPPALPPELEPDVLPLVPPAPEVEEPWRSRQFWRSVPVRPTHWLDEPPLAPPLALSMEPAAALPLEEPLPTEPAGAPTLEPLVPELPLPALAPPAALPALPPAPPLCAHAIVPMPNNAAASAAKMVLLFMIRL
ncbi:MAG: hypothetical protein E6H77_05970 [Betaproteobacteria bacterium]|nr:MAG: hypothetical protein E6H77_05970 [Betaproteobacteria bacterium]